MRKITKFCMVLLTMVMTNNILFGQSELEDFTKSETELKKLNKKELREYVSFLENISDSLLRKKNDNIVGLQSQLKEKKSRIISIENEIEKLKTLQSKLESEKSELQSEKSKLESEKSELQSDKSKLESEKSELENKLENLSILVSKNNEELNLLRKLYGIEKDTIQKNHDIKEIGDGSVISVGELTLTPNGYKYQNKPYTGYLWNLKEGNYIFDCHQTTSDRSVVTSDYIDLYFGMVKNGIKDGIWVENKKYSDNTVVISKYDEGKIYNGFTLEIDWDITYHLIKNKLRLNNFFDSLPDDFQFIEITENVEEQTDNITKNFKYEGNKTYVERKKMELYLKSLNPQEKIDFTKRLYKVLCEELNKVEKLTDLLIILNDFTKNKFVPKYNVWYVESTEMSFKFDNYDLGMKNGLSIDSKLKCTIGSRTEHPSSKDVNQKKSCTYGWDIDVSYYKNGELEGSSIKGKYTYRKDGTTRGVIKYPQFVDEKRYWKTYRKGKTENLLKYLRKERSGVPNIYQRFEETSPNKTDITFFTSKPEFISISETDEYQLENYKQGKKDGVQSYYEKGVLTLKEEYSKGELNGDKEVYKKGIIQSVETFSNGVLTLKKIYENGIIKEEHYCRGVKDSNGYIEKFILKRVIYVNGNLNETWYYKKDIGFSDYYIQDKDNTSKITKH